MARGYSKSWGMNFVAHQTNGAVKENEVKWDMQDALKFKLQPHFTLPSDKPVSKDFPHVNASIEADFDRDDVDEMKCRHGALNVSCAAGLAQVKIQSGGGHLIIHVIMDVDQKGTCTMLSVDTVGEKFDQTQPLKITALGLNGRQRVVADMWPILRENPYIFVLDSDLVLRERSVRSAHLDGDDDADNFVGWAMFLGHRGQDGQLHRATSIDLRVGCTMDGAVVYYADGQHASCGPAGEHHFGGHASESHDLRADETITKVRQGL